MKSATLRVTKTDLVDNAGCAKLLIQLVSEDGQVVDSIFARSGIPGRQVFYPGWKSKKGSNTPLPEGYYKVSGPFWAGAPDDWSKVFNEGIGAVCFELTPLFHTERSNLLEHQDANAAKSPGTAGCVGYYTKEDMQKRLDWSKQYSIGRMIVNYGCGTVETTPETQALKTKPQTSGPSKGAGKPMIKWVPGCPNVGERAHGTKITTIINHYSVSPTEDGIISWFMNPKSYVSSHFVVGKDGVIYQLVDMAKKAFHCWKNNDYSIGIEHVAMPGDHLTPAQEKATVALQKWICHEFGLDPKMTINAHRFMPWNEYPGTDCPGDLFGPFEHGKEELRKWVDRNF